MTKSCECKTCDNYCCTKDVCDTNLPLNKKLSKDYPKSVRKRIAKQTKCLLRNLDEACCTKDRKMALKHQLYVYSKGKEGRKTYCKSCKKC